VIVERAAVLLAEQGVETARADAEWIVAHVLGVKRSELVLNHSVDDRLVWPLVERRSQREPLAYVLGEWGFRRLVLRCDSRALVPRPETEVVVERCLELLRTSVSGLESPRPPRVLDVGTGTGAIALALAHEAGADVVAMDASADALALARENAERLRLDVEFVHGDLRAGLPPGPFELVVSNPPYVRADELDALEPEVRDWEPRAALVDEGQTEALVVSARRVLVPGGRLVLEVHEQYVDEMTAQLRDRGYAEVTITHDLAGRERVVDGRRT